MASAAQTSAGTGGSEGGEPPADARPGDGAGNRRGGMAEGEGRRQMGGGSAGGGAGGSGARQASASESQTGNSEATPSAASPVANRSIDLLTGNSLVGTGSGGERIIRYLSRQGWQAVQIQPNTLVVRRWVTRGERLCDFTSASTMDCERVTTAAADAPKDGVGAVLGTATLGKGERWTILRGNVAAVPDVIPLIDGDQPAHDDALATKALLTGKPAIAALVGRTLLTATTKSPLAGTRYEADGRWLDVAPLQLTDTTGTGGVRVALGHWLSKDGLLCTDQGGLTLDRSCYRPEQWGSQTFRLTASRTAAVTTLVTAAPSH